jgi:hypothetical protein
MASAMRVSSRPLGRNHNDAASGTWRGKFVWAKAIHRIVTEGISPELVIDQAIARIKEILSD